MGHDFVELVMGGIAYAEPRATRRTLGGHNENDVGEALCGMIVNQTDVERERIKPESKIVKDLGLD
jgi:hypothetical protein